LTEIQRKGLKKYLIIVGLVFVLSVLLFIFSRFFQDDYNRVMGVSSYLSWHIVFEMLSVIISFSIFFIAYFKFDETRILRSIFLGFVFLITGVTDFFYTFTYKGMPGLFLNTSGTNISITFWTIARLVSGIGFLIAFSLDEKKKTKLVKRCFFIPSAAICIFIFCIVTCKPRILPVMFDETTGLTVTKVVIEYFVMLLFLITILKNFRSYVKTNNEVYIIFSLGLIFGIISEFAFVLYKTDVYNLYNYLGHIYKMIAFLFIFNAIFIHDVKKPYSDLKAAKDEVSIYAENLDRIVETRTKMLKSSNTKLLKNLDYAREIQRSMMPRDIPKIKNISINTGYYPAEHVTGDFFNVFKLEDNIIGFYLGDVSGHGIPAAMLSVFLNQSIKVIGEYNRKSMLNPAYVLNEVYSEFNRTNFTEDVYSVVLYGVIDLKKMLLTVSSAGLNVSPLFIRDNEIKEIKIHGMPVIKFGEYITPFYENKTIELKKHDRLFFYTDGVVEARNIDKEWYGEERLKRVLLAEEKKDSEDIGKQIVNDVFKHIGDNVINDDITYIHFKI
jgi:sigma-B regulation protein RsbU (phosphoserine phosphatase)